MTWKVGRSQRILAIALAALVVLAVAGGGFLVGSMREPTPATLIPGSPNAVTVARYGAAPSGPGADTTQWTAQSVVSVTDSKLVAKLAADANSLPPIPNGNYSCPYSDGSRYQLQFGFADGDRITLNAERQGCQGVAYQSRPDRSVAWSLTDHSLLDDLDALFR
jgi:hypothetical protein